MTMNDAAAVERADGLAPAAAVRSDRAVRAQLSELDRHKLLHLWNDTHAEFPDVCAHVLFERQVERTPNGIAVVFGEQRMTYRELNDRANQVAHTLRARGVGADTLVGVAFERTPELVVALLSVWKAGGAYVPLDVGYPAERLSFMVEDAAVRLLLTQDRHRHLFPSAAGKTICLDSDWPKLAGMSSQNPAGGATPANLAYVMYTSGSTGRPKGAMILHRGLVNYLTWAIETYALEPGGSVPVHTSVSFDLTVTSLYPALLSGGYAELIPEDVGAQNLLAALRQGPARNLVKITPAHLDLLAQQVRPEEAADMTKLFVIGGENLAAESLRLWRESAPGTRLINEYGPTETVVGCCVYELQPGDPRNGSVPIGRPIANTRLYVLDDSLQPVAIGATGELYIGGEGVARGYLNRPELTRERFLPDPFSGVPDARLYKTGDLARYRPDGILEYLGRVDNQVKIRGYRIELGEIEAVLAGHPAVQTCVVVAREDSPGNKQLVAYVVPRHGESPASDEVQEFLRQRLPEHMTPRQFVFLQSLPLTNNGKVDRKALPAPGAAPQAVGYRAPRTPTERALAEIWQRLLQRERIGTREDFFDVGGQSLLMIGMLSEITQTFGVDLPQATVIKYTTIETLAMAIEALLTPKVPATPQLELPSCLTELKPGGPRALFFVYDGDGDVLPYLNLARRMPDDYAVYGILPSGLPGIPLAQLTIADMARHCVETIQKQQPTGPYSLGGLCTGGVIAFEAARQLERAGETVDVVMLLDAIQPTTPHHPFLATRRRWQRFRALFQSGGSTNDRDDDRTAESPGRAQGPDGAHWTVKAQRAADKLRNLVVYEAGKSINGVWIGARQRLLEYVLDRGTAWPKAVQPLTVREIYNYRAAQSFGPGTLRGRVVLVKAGRSDDSGGEAGRDLVADPLLGWQAYAAGKVEVIEAPGGHAGMLREPSVDRLAADLLELVRSA
jgi:amino acid adenylation domain-containing protein